MVSFKSLLRETFLRIFFFWLIAAFVANFVSNAQTWRLINPAYPTEDAFIAGYSVKDFGASGNGITDVTSIFQARIDALAATGGGTLFVPKGKYVIKGNLILRKGVILRGEWLKPEKGLPIKGTVLLAYAGRGNENAASIITMEPTSAVQDIAFWYPDQNPENIAKYPPTIVIGEPYYFGNDYCNIKNVTLINSYSGIAFSRVNGGTCPVINGIYGTPLSKGIEIDNISDVGRIENIFFSPAYWEGSGLPGAPVIGSSVEKWIFNNGTGIVMRRNDWSYTCFVDIEGYNRGLHVGPSIASPGTSANGHNYGMTFTNCNTALYFETTSDVGIMYARIKIINCNNGFTFGPNIKFPVQLHTCEISANQNAITTDAASTLKLMMQKCIINKGQVIISGGTLSASDCDFNDSIHKIILGSNSRSILTGNRFVNAALLQNNSLLDNISDQAPVNLPYLPEYTDSLPRNQKPSRLFMYNASLAPFNAKNDGTTDNTEAIQFALDSAFSAGGGIVFLPPGKYKVLGNLSVPSGVELKGASDLGAAPMGAGSILEVYAGRGNESGIPFIKLSSESGIRGIVFDYPEQMGDSVPNFPAYPYCIQVTGSDVYIVNVGMRGTYNGIDLFTYQCNNHYLDYIAGHVFKTGVKVGGNSSGGKISNLQFNPIGYVYGYESKWGIWPNAPSPGNIGNIVDYVKNNLSFLVLENCTNETLYNDFSYGSQSGLILSGASGISLGMGIDGSRKSLYIESIGSGGFNFINSQIVAIDNLPGTCYIQTKSGFTSNVSLFNSDYWGYCEYGIAQEGGTLDFENANFQYPGSSAFANISGGNTLLKNSSIMPVNTLLVSGDEPMFSAESSVLDSSGITASACALWKNNLGNSGVLNANYTLSRSDWTATASNNNPQAGLAIDGDISTRWSTLTNMTDGQWFTVDMKTNNVFNHIILGIYLVSPYDYPVGYSVFVSTDSITWTGPIATGSGSQGMTAINFPSQNARYIKIIQNGSKNFWWSINELYVLHNIDSEPVTEISVIPSSVKLGIDSIFQLTDTIAPNSALDKKVNWASSNSKVATVDNNGLVTAVSVGSAEITVTADDGAITASSVITVSIPVTGISLLPTSVMLYVDSVQLLTATITPADATFPYISWSSDNPLIASVSNDGKVTGISKGTAVIIVSDADGNFIDTCLVNVLGSFGGFTVYTYLPGGWSTPEKIFWWNADPADTLANGTWPGVNMDTMINNTTGWYKHTFRNVLATNLIFDDGNGHQTINLFRSSKGWYLDNTWYDYDPSHVTAISISPANINLTGTAATQQLTAVISPQYALNKAVNWSSGNTSVATVNSNGMITSVGPGSAIIKATSLDGGISDSTTITVSPGTGISRIYDADKRIAIYPNPASSIVYLGFNLTKSSEIVIEIYNVNGVVVKSERQYVNSGNQDFKLNIGNIPTGVYIIRIVANDLLITRKLVVK